MGNTPTKSKRSEETTPLLTNDQDVGPELETTAVARPKTRAEQLAQIEEEEARILALFQADLASRRQPILDQVTSHDTEALTQETVLFKRRQPVEEKSGWFSCFACFFGKKEAREEDKSLSRKRGIN